MLRLVYIALAVLVVGCTTDRTDLIEDDHADIVDSYEDAETRGSPIPLRIPDPTRSDQESLVLANSDFALDLYSRLRRQDGNLVFSPYMISNSLAMCYAGARGQTASEIAGCLRLPFEQDRTHAAFHDLNDALRSSLTEQGVTLALASRLWADEDLDVSGSFLNLTREKYEAELAKVAFAAPQKASRDINEWIDRTTHGRIRGLVSAPDLQNARLLLTCSIYFNATWAHPFIKSLTKPAPFHTAAANALEVPMMQFDDIIQAFRISETDELQVLEMTYNIPPRSKGDFRMLVLLPKRRDGLRKLESTLTTDSLSQWVSRLEHDHVVVYLPRFAATSRFDMAELLGQMRVTAAFDSQHADFSGIADREALYLIKAVHAATINVDEKGTEAAATQYWSAGADDDSEPLIFRADHPFLFLVRHHPTGTILFLGRIVDPAAA